MKRMVLFVLLIVLCSSCTSTAVPVSPESTLEPAPVILPSETVVPTLEATSTSLPTATLEPSPTPTPIPVAISVENAEDLKLKNSIGSGEVLQVVFSPDEAQVLVLTSAGLHMYDAESAKQTWSQEDIEVFRQAQFSNDGEKIYALANSGKIKICDSATGKDCKYILETKKNIQFSTLSQAADKLLIRYPNKQTEILDINSDTVVATNNGQSFPMGIMNRADLSPKGDYFVISGFDSQRKVQTQMWDAASGKFLMSMSAGNVWLFDFQYSTDGKYVAGIANKKVAADMYSVIMIWRLDTFQLYANIELKGSASHFAMSPDATLAFVTFSEDSKVAKIDIQKAKSERDDIIRKRDVKDKSMVIYEPEWLQGGESFMKLITISPQGKYLAAMEYNGFITLMNIATGEKSNLAQINQSRASLYIADNALSHSGEIAAVTSPDSTGIDLIDFKSGTNIKHLQAEDGYYYYALSFSINDKKLAAAKNLKDTKNSSVPSQEIVIWNIESGDVIATLSSNQKSRIATTQFSPDGNLVAAISPGQLFVWDLATSEKKQEFGGWSTFNFSQDNQYVLYDNADLGVYISDLSTGKLVTSQKAEYLYDLSYSPDGSVIALAGYQVQKLPKDHIDILYFMDAEKPYTRQPLVINDYPSTVIKICYSPDGTMISSIDAYGSLYIHDTVEGKLLKMIEGKIYGPTFLQFTPDSQAIVVGNSDGSIESFGID